MKLHASLTVIACTAVLFSGCGEQQVEKREAPVDGAIAEPPSRPPSTIPPKKKAPLTAEQLEAALIEKNPDFKGGVETADNGTMLTAVKINNAPISDISSLAGLKLMHLDLTGCPVSDISVLKGMPLCVLYLGETKVKDISPLKGIASLMQVHLNDTEVADLSPLTGSPYLQELHLDGAWVSDLSPLRGMPRLQMLWLTGCPVTDIAPLAAVPSLVSLTIAETDVSDLSSLKGHQNLERLHIAKTDVTDLSVLETLGLQRLIFTPNRIKTGIEIARNCPTLRNVDVRFGGEYTRPMPAAQFWSLYDAGEFK